MTTTDVGSARSDATVVPRERVISKAEGWRRR